MIKSIPRWSIPILLLALFFGSVFSQTTYGKNNESAKLRFSKIRLKTGVQLHYAERGNPSGPVVLMLHGLTDSWFSYSRVLPSIDPKYHVYILDQRGHGDSDKPRGGYSAAEFAVDALAFMDAKGLKHVMLVGHSMGSFVAQQVAALAPDRVTKLVLIGSAASIKNDVVKGLQQEVNAFTDSVPEKFLREFQQGTMARPVPDEFLNSLIKESSKLPAHVFKAVVNDLVAGEDAQLRKIKSSTLIIWGDRETVFSRSEQETLLAAIPNARLVVYEGTGHSPNWEVPERVARDLQDFFEEGQAAAN